jgi:hypothetical protein
MTIFGGGTLVAAICGILSTQPKEAIRRNGDV